MHFSVPILNFSLKRFLKYFYKNNHSEKIPYIFSKKKDFLYFRKRNYFIFSPKNVFLIFWKIDLSGPEFKKLIFFYLSGGNFKPKLEKSKKIHPHKILIFQEMELSSFKIKKFLTFPEMEVSRLLLYLVLFNYSFFSYRALNNALHLTEFGYILRVKWKKNICASGNEIILQIILRTFKDLNLY